MADWKDLAVVLCAALVVLGASALAVAANSFSIVKGKVVEKGTGIIEHGGKRALTPTISVFIENDDRVFDVRAGTIVWYPVTEADAQAIEVGSEVELFVSSSKATVKVLSGHSSRLL
jgi:hypothetical protein